MKKTVQFSMLVIMLVLTSCNQLDEKISNDEKQITFTISNDEDQTRSRTNVLSRYIMEVYEGTNVESIPIEFVIQDNGIFTLSLETTKSYVILFWADYSNGIYNTTTLKSINLAGGAEASEAFFASQVVTSLDITNYKIALKRAVAKVNLIETNVVTPNVDLTATFQHYTQFNVFNGEVTGSASLISKTFNSAVTTGELGSFLTFAPVGGITTNFDFTYGTEKVISVTNVPLKANFITNISGEFSPEAPSKILIFELIADGNWEIEKEVPLINIPDVQFNKYLTSNFDLNADGGISHDEAALIKEININNSNISSVEGVEFFSNLSKLDLSMNKLTSIDLSDNINLTDLHLGGNQLTEINVTKNVLLNNVVLTPMQSLKGLTIKVGTNTQEWTIPSTTTVTNDGNNAEITIEDNNFKNYLVTNFDKNTDGKISTDEALLVNMINIQDVISSAKGIEHFVNLISLNLTGNQLTTLDVSKCTKLKQLYINKNKLTSIDVSNNVLLEILACSNNMLNSIELSKCVALTHLEIYGNKIISIDVSKNEFLDEQIYDYYPVEFAPMATLKTLIVKAGSNIEHWQIPTETHVEYAVTR